jgi:metal-responsive CopG/Arc/MetJ family transcriptional regulator
MFGGIVYLPPRWKMAKCKVSVTVESKLMERVDEISGESTRSQIVEEALAFWIRNRRRRQLDMDTEKYYADMSADERAEDADWAERGLGGLGKTWD